MTDRRPGQPTKPAPTSRSGGKRSIPLLPVVAGVVIVLAVVAVIIGATSGSDDGSSSSGISQTRPVTVNGTPLPDFADTGNDPAVGMPLPEIRGASFDGTPVEIVNDGKGKVIILVAHWCPHCQREVPLLTDYLGDHPVPAGVELVAISTSVNAAAPNYPPSTWLADAKWPVMTLADDKDNTAAKAVGLTAFPTFIVTDASGKVVTRTTGELTTEQFADLMNQAAASSG